MKIVHLEAGRHLYGGAQQVCYLIDELARGGIENVLVCPPGAAFTRRAAAAEVVEVPIAGDLDLGLVRRLRRLFVSLKPDLVHVHSRRGADLYGGLAARSRWPAVLTRRVDSAEWQRWARFKYGRYAALVAISRIVESRLLDAGLPRERVHRVPSGIDTERFRPDPAARARLLDAFSLPPDAFVVGVIAQLIPRKGHERLLGRIPVLVAKHPRLVVLGFGRGPLAGRLAKQVSANSLQRHVKLAGFRDDLASLLPGLDAVLHPARGEGMGVAVLEALSAGVPVVASRVGGIVDVIEHGVHGLLVEPGDQRGWVGAVEQLLADPDARRRYGAAGRRRVQEQFSASRMAAGNLRIYEAVLGAAHGTSDT
ncbi:MAG TPA: glycosyltransferase family 4 protein [Gammaproteobacteria bacterium]|nr:glycosyltransferase family 4 protein [Gammaproteobacteria bacterium]